MLKVYINPLMGYGYGV